MNHKPTSASPAFRSAPRRMAMRFFADMLLSMRLSDVLLCVTGISALFILLAAAFDR